MSYWDQADLADDGDLRRRVIACAAREHVADPESWAYMRRWELSTQPGWVDAYASARADSVEFPGRDEVVISDGMILAAVQTLKQPEVPTSPAE